MLVAKISMRGGIGEVKQHYSPLIILPLLSGIVPSPKYNIFATNKLYLVIAFGFTVQGIVQINGKKPHFMLSKSRLLCSPD